MARKEKLNIFDRLLGRPLTDPPKDVGAWAYNDHTLTLDLNKLPELKNQGSAVRLEGQQLPDPVLVILGDDGNYYAYKNKCMHMGRRVDPIAGTMKLECCSVNKASYDYEGKVLSGPAKGPLTLYPVTVEGDRISINI